MSVRTMTVRKLFAAVALTSLAGVAVFGGVFAWKASDSARGAALVGKNQFTIRYAPECTAASAQAVSDPEDGVSIPCLTLLGWNGQATLVGKGAGKNEGDFRLVVTGGKVEVRRVLSAIDPATPEVSTEAAGCQAGHFGGRVNILDHGVIPPGGEGGKFEAYLKVADNAPARCQGAVVIYKVTIEAENPPNATAEPADVVAASR